MDSSLHRDGPNFHITRADDDGGKRRGRKSKKALSRSMLREIWTTAIPTSILKCSTQAHCEFYYIPLIFVKEEENLKTPQGVRSTFSRSLVLSRGNSYRGGAALLLREIIPPIPPFRSSRGAEEP